MTITIDANASVTYDTVTSPDDALPNSTLITMYRLSDYDLLQPSNIVETLQIDLVRATQMGYDEVHRFVFEKMVPEFANQGYSLMAFAAYEQTLLDVKIPSNICILGQCYNIPQFCIPGTAWLCGGQDCCFGGGSTVASAYKYRFWYLLQPVAPSFPMAVRPLGPLVVLAFGLVIIATLLSLMAIIGFVNGKLTWSQAKSAYDSIFHIPQENNPLAPAAGAFPWAIAALGFTMVASSLALGYIYSKGGAAPVIGPPLLHGEGAAKIGPVTVGGGFTPPAPPPAAPAARGGRRR